MADDFNQTNQPGSGSFDPNRPRLKKVKRPVRRVDGQSNAAVPPKAPGYTQQPLPPRRPVQPETDEEFNLDSLLDDNNLPAVNAGGEPESDFQPQFIDESDITPPKTTGIESLVSNNMFTKKAVALNGAILFITGFFTAKIFFAEATIVRDGLQGVVINSEVPRGRARCGVAERTQGCVLYIMNPQRQELSARDFYDLASQLTGRQRFVIETGNMRYSNVKIRPGGIAQLNIPPLQ